MSRQITFYKFEVGIQQMVEAEDGRFDLIRKPVATVEDSSMTKTEIRKAIMEAGAECKRGTEVYATKVGRVVYKFTTEALKSIAESREELPLD